MSAEEAVFVQMEKVGLLRGYSGRMRAAIKAAANALEVGDSAFALKTLRDALSVAVPEAR